MQPNFIRKGMVLVIIGLFMGAGFVPSISGDIEEKQDNETRDYVDVVSIIPDDQLDQYQLTNNGGFCVTNPNFDCMIAQSFKPTLNNLTRIWLVFVKEGNPSGDIEISIRSSLDGDDLVSKTISSNLEEYIETWVEFVIPELTISSEETYYIIWHLDNYDQNNLIYICSNDIDDYCRGKSFFNNENSWDDEPGDLAFKTYGYGVGNPAVEVEEIQGGFRINAVLKNYGTATATDVDWSIELDGGFILMGGSSDGTITELATGESETVKLDSLFGIGNTVITVTAGDATKQAAGFILGPLVLGV